MMLITGKSERMGSRMLQEIRAYYGKGIGAYMTFKEFAEFTGIPEQAVDDLPLVVSASERNVLD